MEIVININCDNAAFKDNESHEAARILRVLALKIRDFDKLESTTYITAYDLNGNNVGYLAVVIRR